jgi:tripartite-type tricarboxylate transporter receptor subunit TctC
MRKLVAAAAIAAILQGSAPASAQPGPSLAGKTVNVIIGFGTGGAFDTWGRAVARHLRKHLPGHPNVVPQNMPGAAGYVAANHIYNVAPKDGTALAVISGTTVLGPITGASGARFDPTRFTWLGTPGIESNVCVVFDRPQLKVRSFNDLYANELIVGSAGAGAGPHIIPKALNALLGTKFKVVGGFPTTAAVFLAMERGEVEGICPTFNSVASQRPDWIADRKVLLLFHGGGGNPLFKDVPFAPDLANNPTDRAAIEFLFAGNGLGRPFFAPPDMAAERATMLQDAFMATMHDPEFIADAHKQKLDIEPEDGAYLAALVRKIYATPKAIVDSIAELTK